MSSLDIHKKTLAYLTTHFCELDELATLANTPSEVIKTYINLGCIPDFSYRLETSMRLFSNLFGDIADGENDFHYFYARNNTAWITRANNIAARHGIDNVARVLTDEMRIRFKKLFIENNAYLYGFEYLFDINQTLLDDVFEKEFQEILFYWRNGTYSLCVKNMVNEDRLFHKKLTQRWLKKLTHDGTKKEYTSEEKANLKIALAKYEEYIMPFSPFEYPMSSKKNLVDNIKLLLEKSLASI